MICPNSKSISKHISQCSALLEHGIQFIVAESRSGSPCHICKTQWVSGEVPTKDNLTPQMELVIKANGKIELPTITEQATNFIGSLVKWVGAGFENVPKDEQKRRIAICESSLCGMFNQIERRCEACSCFVDLKVRWSGQSCPAGYWGTSDLPPEIIHGAPQGCRSCGKR